MGIPELTELLGVTSNSGYIDFLTKSSERHSDGAVVHVGPGVADSHSGVS